MCDSFRFPALAAACKENDGYETPSLNDKLYLHFGGFHKIENLDEYVNLKALWLDSNAIAKIENLSHLTELRSLFLQQNLITQITGLESLQNLHTLNLENNQITFVSGLSQLKSLQTLNLSKNRLSEASALVHLQECMALNNLDISDNLLDAKDDSVSDIIADMDKANEEAGNNLKANQIIKESPPVLRILSRIPKLRALYLKGNPIVRNTRHYRKVVLTTLPNLHYLDERPVFANEKFSTEAWVQGGVEGERAAKAELEERQKQEARDTTAKFSAWRESIREKRKQELERLNKERAEQGLSLLLDLPLRGGATYVRVKNDKLTEAQRLALITREMENAIHEGKVDEAIQSIAERHWESGLLMSEKDVDEDREENVLMIKAQPEAHRDAQTDEGVLAGDERTEQSDEELCLVSAPNSRILTERAEEEEQRKLLEKVLREEREERAKLMKASAEAQRKVREALGKRITMEDMASSTSSKANDDVTKSPDMDYSLSIEQQRVKDSLAMFEKRENLDQAQLDAEGEAESEEGETFETEVQESLDQEASKRQQESDQWSRLARRFEQMQTESKQTPPEGEAPMDIVEDSSDAASEESVEVVTKMMWFPALDNALVKFAKQSDYSFDKVSRGLQQALKKNVLKIPANPVPKPTEKHPEFVYCTLPEIVSRLTPELCQARLMALQIGNAVPPSQELQVAEKKERTENVWEEAFKQVRKRKEVTAPISLRGAEEDMDVLLGKKGYKGTETNSVPVVPFARLLKGLNFELQSYQDYVSIQPSVIPSSLEDIDLDSVGGESGNNPVKWIGRGGVSELLTATANMQGTNTDASSLPTSRGSDDSDDDEVVAPLSVTQLKLKLSLQSAQKGLVQSTGESKGVKPAHQTSLDDLD